MGSIHVTSEIKPLKKVLLHRPGKELLNLTPETLERLLFDDIPFLKVAQQEHDAFAKILKDNGVEVVCLFDGDYTVTNRGDNSKFMDYKVWPRQTESDQRLNGTIDVVANIGGVQKEGHLDVYQKENPWVLASPWTVIIV